MSVLISGATRGIGKAIAKKLSSHGYDLILLARSQNDLDEVQKELSSGKGKIITQTVDLSDIKEVQQLKQILPELSEVEVLINNLGVYSMDGAAGISTQNIQEQLEKNLFSAVELTNLILPHLSAKENGIIVNIGSVMGIEASPNSCFLFYQ